MRPIARTIGVATLFAVTLILRGQYSTAPARADTIAERELATWKRIKATLLAPDGQSYFDMNVKGALLPTFRGKVVSLEPGTNSTTIVLAIEDGVTPDATLKFYGPLKGKVDAGTKLSFEGVGESFTASPFMLVFHVDPDKLHGWPSSR